VRKIIGPENIPASLVEEREILKKKRHDIPVFKPKIQKLRGEVVLLIAKLKNVKIKVMLIFSSDVKEVTNKCISQKEKAKHFKIFENLQHNLNHVDKASSHTTDRVK